MKKETIHILLLEDDENDVALIRRAFESSDLAVQLTLAEARAFLEKSRPDMAIAAPTPLI